uniref:Kelch repeat-containing protein n=1 Tax=Caulobacter sp. (strain K31) TaxID=366602 RepID=B0T4I8_CAUSK
MTGSPGKRPTLGFGLGRYADFFAQMVDALPTTTVKRPDGASVQPLAALTERLLSDPTIALIDAAAAVADIVSFYQDRILNEGYLPTAVERRSLALLGRMLGFAPPGFVGATTQMAMFVESGAKGPVVAPAGTPLQASAAAGKSGPTFELSESLSAQAALNKLPPLQTRPATLDQDATSVLIQGTGLGLSAGDPLLLIHTYAGAKQWLRMAVTRTRENHTLSCTEVFWGRPLNYQWEENGTGGPAPEGPTDQLDLYVLRLGCRLFGFNAPAWSAQSYAVQLANTPPGHYPSEYTEWPNFGIDLDNLDLQGVYSKVLPASGATPSDSVLLLEDPQTKRLGSIEAVAPVMVSAFGMSGQVSRITLQSGSDPRPTGRLLQPPRYGHSAVQVPTGQVMIIGGDSAAGVLESVELFDPATQLLTAGPPLPTSRAFQTATVVGEELILIGGADDDDLASDVLHLSLDGESLAFSLVAKARLPTPRARHQATALPDGRIMISGGCCNPDGKPKPATMDFETWFDSLPVTSSVTIYNPVTGEFSEEARLQHPRAAHTATLCPVFDGRPWDKKTEGEKPALGQTVVFVGGYDLSGGDRQAWADAEVTMPWTSDTWGKALAGQLVPQLFQIEQLVDGIWTRAKGRFAHRATLLSTQVAMLTGGVEASGAVAGDTWLMCCFADVAPVAQPGGATNPDPFILGVPSFVQTGPLKTPRYNHVAAFLPEESRLVLAGGQDADGVALDAVEFYDIIPGLPIPEKGAEAVRGPQAGAKLTQAQALSVGVVLTNGQLFLSGGLSQVHPPIFLDTVAIYDPASYTFIERPGPIFPNADTLVTNVLPLTDGTILITGCVYENDAYTGLAWTYDPSTNLSTLIAPGPTAVRICGSATQLQNGTVLLAGGAIDFDVDVGHALNTAEIYDPRNRAFHKIFSTMSANRVGHTATALPDGTVLLTGGFGALNVMLNTADLFNPLTQAFTSISTQLPAAVCWHDATSLQSGDVLITGGIGDTGISDTAAVYNFAAQAFAPIGSMTTPRAYHTGTLLKDGRVLLAGGLTGKTVFTAATEFYEPEAVGFTAGDDLLAPRAGHGAVLLTDTSGPTPVESVLLIGGDATMSSAEILTPGATPEHELLSVPISLPPSPITPESLLNFPVQPALLAAYGVFAFGAVYSSANATAQAALFVLPPPPPTVDARRDSLVFTQSQLLSFAPPIDTSPIQGQTLVLAGLIQALKPGSPLLVTGLPPLAQTVGEVPKVGGGAPLPDGTLLMVTAQVPSADTDSWWSVETADGRLLTVKTAPGGAPITTFDASAADDQPPTTTSGFTFMSGNGKDIGNIPASVAARFVRPLRGEMAVVRSVTLQPDTGTTTVELDAPLRDYYDRTTMTLYGNVVEATQGATVAGEVLGSGDGTTAFQVFTLKQAPLTFLADRGGGVAPALTVSVAGVPWTRVMSLSQAGPTDRSYQLTLDAQGRAQITFGDGVHGQRPSTGTDNITATYRIGAGSEGNVAAGALNRTPSQVGGISGVLNPLPATGGVGAPGRGAARRQIPLSVKDLGRIVTEADFLSFVLNYPIVAQATLSLAPPLLDDGSPNPQPVVLVTVAGPDGAVPDPDADGFVSLAQAMKQAMPRPIPHTLFAYQPKLFKVVAELTIEDGAAQAALEAQAKQAVQTAYSPAAMRFGVAVRAADIALLLKKIQGVDAVTVTYLWVPAEHGQRLDPILKPAPATNTPPAHGAQILSISDDSDAVVFTIGVTPPTSGGATS